MSQEPIYRVLGLLEGVKKSGEGYSARCPTTAHKHGDKSPSLSVGIGHDGRVLLTCHTGCATDDVLAAIGLTMTDLFEHSTRGNVVQRYRIADRNGTVVAVHVREDLADGSKKMGWESGGKHSLNGTAVVDLPLYRLDLLAGDQSRPVILCEGEKAADALAELGLLALATVTGAAATPSEATLAPLLGRDVWLWPDNDLPGLAHMQRVATGLKQACKWIVWVGAPEKGDAADYVAAGGTAEGVAAMVGGQHQDAGATSGPRLDIVRMADVEPEPVEWLWRGRLARGKPTILMGDPGLGKSLITHWIAATVSRGGEWPDGQRCEPGAAILFTTEDGLADTVAPRLLAAGADMAKVYAVRGVIENHEDYASRMFALNEHLAMLEAIIAETGAIYVAMDPVSAYLGPDVNSHKEADVRAVLGPLSLLAERTRVVLLMVMHLNKGTGVSALYRASGSIAFPAVARVVLGIGPDPNDDTGKRRVLLPVKMNIGKPTEGIGYHIETAAIGPNTVLRAATEEDQPPVLVWDLDPVSVDAASAMDRNGTVQELGAVAETKLALSEILSNGRVPTSECKRQLRESGCSTNDRTLSQVRKELGVRVRKDGFGSSGVWYWELNSPTTSEQIEDDEWR